MIKDLLCLCSRDLTDALCVKCDTQISMCDNHTPTRPVQREKLGLQSMSLKQPLNCLDWLFHHVSSQTDFPHSI